MSCRDLSIPRLSPGTAYLFFVLLFIAIGTPKVFSGDMEGSGSNQSLIAEGASVEKLSGGFTFTEGPAADKEGNVYFTDIPENKIYIWSTNGQLSTFVEESGNANGLAFDKKGKLIACQHGGRGVFSFDADGSETLLVGQYQEKKLNSPNDLWIDRAGGIYFTDPRYGNRDNMEQDGEHVYYLSPDGKKLTRVIDDLVRPNGIIGTPDGKILYVADNADKKTFVYKINKDGTLSNKKQFAPDGSDGVTLDEHWNLYLTTDAVLIYSPEGKLLERIETPEQPSNVCFSGKDGKTLFITARTSIYAVKMKVGPATAK